MSDITGFDSPYPLSVPNPDRYQFDIIYTYGMNAFRIIPDFEFSVIQSKPILPLAVLRNRCPNCLESGMNSISGVSDCIGYVDDLLRRGFKPGELVGFDWEYGSELVPGFSDYSSACGVYVKSKGFYAAHYGTDAILRAINRNAIDAVYLTDWTYTTDPDPVSSYWRSLFPAFAWQDGNTVPNADLDICTPQFFSLLRNGGTVNDSQLFNNGFTSGGGFYAFWLHNGGLIAYGMPISKEYDTTDFNGKPVRRQWYERAIFEWRKDQWPSNWDTLPVLLAEIVEEDSSELTHYITDARNHADAFKN